MLAVRPLAAFGRHDLDVAGAKGANLGELLRAGFAVPDGFVVTTDAYRSSVARLGLQDTIVRQATETVARQPPDWDAAAAALRAHFTPASVEGELRRDLAVAYTELGGGSVAVRSSATAEDLADASFAGQQDTYLNVEGIDALLAAVTRCWASLWNARALAYRAHRGVDPAGVSLAVVVQRLVPAEAAGVLFTANPANGRRDEVAISAAWGLGEAVVSGLVDTDDLVVSGATGRVLSRRTADKAVLTVPVAGGTQEREVAGELRRRPVLDDDAAAELARLGIEVQTHFGAPQDIKWARSGGSFVLLQSRPITALPPAAADPPTEWPVPAASSYYFRASIVEQLPDPLTPLFADLVGPSVSRSVLAVMREVLHRDFLTDADIGLPTINGYAYYAYRRSSMLKMTLASPRALGRLVRGGDRGFVARWRTYSRPHYQEAVDRQTARRAEELPSQELLAGVMKLLDAGTEYYTSVQTVIPLAASSEIFFSAFYEKAVRRPADPPASTFLLGFDSVPILAEKSLWDLARWARSRAGLAADLRTTGTEELVERFRGEREPRRRDRRDRRGDWAEFCSRFDQHLDRYGHLVYNLDFANPVPADDPAPLLDTLRLYLEGQGGDPYARQQRAVARREQARTETEGRLDLLRRAVFRRLLHWTQRVGPERENALADVGLAWPGMRRMLAELGRRLVAAEILVDPDDVYWLRLPELTAALQARPDGGWPSADEIEGRRALWRGRRRAVPPQWLPRGGWIDLMARWMPATAADQSGNVLTGIGASPGRVTAVARVLDGPQDFAQLQPGDILVAAITTPAWTPLFARASAVVTDIGGPLSHSSIVAREYGIPAVLGTSVATRRIRSGQSITVDGDQATVALAAATSVEPDRWH